MDSADMSDLAPLKLDADADADADAETAGVLPDATAAAAHGEASQPPAEGGAACGAAPQGSLASSTTSASLLLSSPPPAAVAAAPANAAGVPLALQQQQQQQQQQQPLPPSPPPLALSRAPSDADLLLDAVAERAATSSGPDGQLQPGDQSQERASSPGGPHQLANRLSTSSLARFFGGGGGGRSPRSKSPAQGWSSSSASASRAPSRTGKDEQDPSGGDGATIPLLDPSFDEDIEPLKIEESDPEPAKQELASEEPRRSPIAAIGHAAANGGSSSSLLDALLPPVARPRPRPPLSDHRQQEERHEPGVKSDGDVGSGERAGSQRDSAVTILAPAALHISASDPGLDASTALLAGDTAASESAASDSISTSATTAALVAAAAAATVAATAAATGISGTGRGAPSGRKTSLPALGASEKRPSLLKKAKELPGTLPVQDFHRVDTGDDEPLTSPEPRSRNPLDEHPKVGFIIGDEELHPGDQGPWADRKDKLSEHTKDKHASGRLHRFHAHHQPKDHREAAHHLQPESGQPSSKRYRLAEDELLGGLLSTVHQDDLISHRFEDPRAVRRHLIHRTATAPVAPRAGRPPGSQTHHGGAPGPRGGPGGEEYDDEDDDARAVAGSGVGREFPADDYDNGIGGGGGDDKAAFGSAAAKKAYDHTPHEVFVELSELVSNQWKETARWIKYEENVEQDVDRWGAPHVASLSFNDLGVLKKCLGKAVVLLDLEERDLAAICNRIVDAMVNAGQIGEHNRGVVFRALLQSHHHVGDEPPGPLKFLRRSSLLGSGYFRPHSSTTSLHNASPTSTAVSAGGGGNAADATARLAASSNGGTGAHDDPPAATVVRDPQRNLSMPTILPIMPSPVMTGGSHSFVRRQQHYNKHDHPQQHHKQELRHQQQADIKADGGEVTTFTVGTMALPRPSHKHHQLQTPPPEHRISITGDDEKPKDKEKATESKEGGVRSLLGRSSFTRNNSSYSVSSQEFVDHHQQAIMKRIPQNSEGICVMVAGLRSLEKTTVAFIRLADSQIIPNVIEIPLPIRFFFVCLGPEAGDVDYHEIGRCISTLMSNKNFHDAAYAAEGRSDLLKAFNQFLGETIVLPPGDYDNKALLPVEDLRKKSENIRRKRERLRRLSERQNQFGKGDGDKGPPTDDVLHNYINVAESSEEKKSGSEDFAPLKRTGTLFGGLRGEIMRRYPQYKSDLVDGFNGQCLATAIFIYFAALSGAITFGGLIGEKTQSLIGVPETLLVTFAGGVIFGILSGQPLIIVGLTGPVLLFDELLYNFCNSSGIDFLAIRVWIAAWCSVIGLLVCAFELSSLVCYFTRFTQEIFSALISLLYLVESFSKLLEIFKANPLLSVDDYILYRLPPNDEPPHPRSAMALPSIPSLAAVSNGSVDEAQQSITDKPPLAAVGVAITPLVTNLSRAVEDTKSDEVIRHQPNTALLSLVLMASTFLIADFFRRFKTSKFLSRQIRVTMGDFAMPIAIVLVVCADHFIPNVYTQKLSVPDGLSTSLPNRGWLINPWGRNAPLETWHIGVAALGGLLVFILLFLEVEICQLIMSKKERKTHKGTGFHLDLLIICFMELGCALVGGPWLCAATVRCVSHLCALTVMNSRVAPGETPQVEGVREQRVTGVLVSVLIGLSVFMGPMLRRVPVAVLFGVFLYMGYTSMMGIQFFERIVLLFKPTKYFPPVPYAQKVRALKMHAFTIIQVLCLAILWAVKQSTLALAFPFVLLCMIPIRLSLRWIFTARELQLLDGDGPVQDPPEDESLRL